MMIHVDQVSSMEDIAVLYVNHLLHTHAMDQQMLAHQQPVDERLHNKLSETMTKLELSEHANKNLLMMVEQQRMVIEGQAQRERELRLELDQALHEREEYLNALGTKTTIREGRKALDQFVQDTRHPDRGE